MSIDYLIHRLQQDSSPFTYVILFFCAALEYVFPPFPGDSVTLFGAFMAARGHYDLGLVFVSVTGGSVLGSLLPYALGRFIANSSEHGRTWGGERGSRAIAAVRRGVDKYGARYLVVNRFLPSVRAFFFVAAGIAKIKSWEVALYGGISAAAWNTLVLVVGYLIGDQWETLRSIFVHYTVATLAGVVILTTSVAIWKYTKRRRS